MFISIYNPELATVISNAIVVRSTTVTPDIDPEDSELLSAAKVNDGSRIHIYQPFEWQRLFPLNHPSSTSVLEISSLMGLKRSQLVAAGPHGKSLTS